jgi:Leu/Phe-tRNA-protein transferase
MEKQNFEYNLIKGRIAETIFELMFRDTKKFSVLHFGYESTVPTLAQYRDTVVMKKVLNQVDKSPDFVLVTENKEQVYFVEVKYRAMLDKEEILKTANEIAKRWELCYLFIVSKDGFYFSPINTVIMNVGEIEPLSQNWVNTNIQEKYRELVSQFLIKSE